MSETEKTFHEDPDVMKRLVMVMWPFAFAEFLYYTYLVWPFLCRKSMPLGRFKMLVV